MQKTRQGRGDKGKGQTDAALLIGALTSCVFFSTGAAADLAVLIVAAGLAVAFLTAAVFLGGVTLSVVSVAGFSTFLVTDLFAVVLTAGFVVAASAVLAVGVFFATTIDHSFCTFVGVFEF